MFAGVGGVPENPRSLTLDPGLLELVEVLDSWALEELLVLESEPLTAVPIMPITRKDPRPIGLGDLAQP